MQIFSDINHFYKNSLILGLYLASKQNIGAQKIQNVLKTKTVELGRRETWLQNVRKVLYQVGRLSRECHINIWKSQEKL